MSKKNEAINVPDQQYSKEDQEKFFKEIFERDKQVKIVNPKYVEREYPKFYQWMQTIIWNNGKSVIYSIQNIDSTEERLKVFIYTHCSQYVIYLRKPIKDEGYIGCGVTNRMERPGETWKRGRDLPDGKYNEETFRKIVNAIVAYELKSVPQYMINA